MFVKVEPCPHAESEIYQLESGENKTESHCCKKTKIQMVLLNLPEFFDIVVKLHIDCIHVASSVALPRCIVATEFRIIHEANQREKATFLSAYPTLTYTNYTYTIAYVTRWVSIKRMPYISQFYNLWSKNYCFCFFTVGKCLSFSWASQIHAAYEHLPPSKQIWTSATTCQLLGTTEGCRQN